MSLEKWNNAPQIPENKPRLYNLESGINVEVYSTEFYPAKQKQENNPKRAVILLPGLAMKSYDKVMQNLGQSYAESSKGKTFVVATRLELGKSTQEKANELDLMYEEAIGIKNFIKEKGFTEITIAGWSQGGDRAINVAKLLQDDLDLKVEGLVLLSPVGLYEQEKGVLKKNLIKDSLVTPFSMLREYKKIRRNPKEYSQALGAGINAAQNVISNLSKNLVKSPSLYAGKLKRDFSEMEKQNPRIGDIHVPVIIITGTKDQVIKPGHIIPFEEEAKIEEDLIERQKQRTERNESREPLYTREKYLKENLFKNSPYVKMVTGERLGKHGLPVFRPEDVAEVSIGLLNRYNKE